LISHSSAPRTVSPSVCELYRLTLCSSPRIGWPQFCKSFRFPELIQSFLTVHSHVHLLSPNKPASPRYHSASFLIAPSKLLCHQATVKCTLFPLPIILAVFSTTQSRAAPFSRNIPSQTYAWDLRWNHL
jgi:hypothetical protein